MPIFAIFSNFPFLPISLCLPFFELSICAKFPVANFPVLPIITICHFRCSQSARAHRMPGRFRAFLSATVQDIYMIVERKDERKDYPICNAKVCHFTPFLRHFYANFKSFLRQFYVIFTPILRHFYANFTSFLRFILRMNFYSILGRKCSLMEVIMQH